ncbi:MAG: hypothetical protein AVO35_05750 [Candidatus Aegiribacteria sp. MLS_C]|nr:MAG: hypothetical protein AVO35_05750 [Candidatus Aegiribacteria sp. MLS_C]
MQLAAAVAEYDRFRAGIFRRRDGLAFEGKLALAFSMAVLTGLLAQVRVYLPWTPVPLTGQVLAVLLSGVVLGGRFGALSQVLYISLGVAGVPWFNGSSAGPAVLFGPTGGYLLGFIPAAYAMGRTVDSCPPARSFPGNVPSMAVVTLLCIYLPGLAGLAFWHHAATGGFPDPLRLLVIGALPFMPGESLKILLAGLGGRILGPPSAFPQSGK